MVGENSWERDLRLEQDHVAAAGGTAESFVQT